MCADVSEERLQIRIHGDAALPTLIYLPGLHGDWTLVTGFRLASAGHVRFVEFTYPRSLTWELNDYAAAIDAKLIENEILHGWILGESYGSQVTWALASPGRQFHVDGIILAGGFVKHPFRWGVCRARDLCNGVSLSWLTKLLFYYGKIARKRNRKQAEVVADIEEFIARRTELDKQAAMQRLRLIAANDPRPFVRQLTVPVYFLTGLFDIIVPWPPVRRWLRKNCPGYRGDRIILRSDHTVLATAPEEAAAQVRKWMGR